MENKKLISVTVLLFCFGIGVAKAQYWYWPEGAGPYFRAGLGPSFYQTGTLRGYSGASPFVSGAQNQPVSYDTGFSANAALGYAFNRYFGIDFGSGYMWTRINNIPNYTVNGSTIGQVPLLANATLSLPIPHTNIIPYLGGGAGGAISILDAHGFQAQTTPANTIFVDGEESDTVFACQAFAGVRFMLTPTFSLGAGYQYFATGNPTFSYPGPGPNLDIGFKGVRTHTVLFTLQAAFW